MAFFYLSFSVPESPSWLVKTRAASTRRAKLLARSAEPDEVRAHARGARRGVSREEKPAPLFAFGARVVLVGVALSVFQQLVGINTVLYYGPKIFATHGLSHGCGLPRHRWSPASVNLLATMVVVLVVDKVGRKPLLIFGGLIMGLSMLVLGSLFHSQQHRGARPRRDLLLPRRASRCRFGPIVWIMMTEIYPGADPRPGHVDRGGGAVDREPAGVRHVPAAARQRHAECRVEPRLPVLAVRRLRHPGGVHRAALRAGDERRGQRICSRRCGAARIWRVARTSRPPAPSD